MKLMEKERKPLIVLTGPTAVGKTKLSIALAKKIGGEIISADSMQVYRHMNIGSAKVTSQEMDGVPHHLIDVLEPSQEFNVVAFQQMAKECLTGIYQRGNIPIIAGGTGFYIQALLYDIDFTENDDHTPIRPKYEEMAHEKGNTCLHELLRQCDPVSAANIHENNVKRVIRALEFYELTGTRISEHNEEQKQKESPYNACYFVLDDVRENLYQRIGERVDSMLKAGLVAEVEKLQQMGCHKEMVSMQGLGYKEILAYLEKECTLEEAVYLIKRDTRHFAKRQLTWFRREKEVLFIEKQDFGYDDTKILDYMIEELQKRKIVAVDAQK